MSDDVQELVEALDLEFWFERESLPYKLTRGRSGDQINCESCPACGDTRYRTYLNAETGRGNCFVCNETFGKLSFIFTHLHGRTPIKGGDSTSWRETFQHVKDCLREQGWRPKRMVAVAVDDTKVRLPLSWALPTSDGQNLVYLEKRGITGELAAYYHLRFCEDGWWNFTKSDGTPSGQNFGNRVIIPVYDLDGALVTFQGRDILGTAERKYLFPSGLPGTGRFLYSGQNAVRMKRVALNEGSFDVFATKIACDEEPELRDIVPIGSFGKNLSYGDPSGNDQLGRFLQLKGYGLEEVIIMWDGEPEALVAALDAAKLLKAIGLRVRIALLPAGKDPNEVAGAVVREAIWKAEPYTPKLDIQWRLRNPYKVPIKAKSFLTALP